MVCIGHLSMPCKAACCVQGLREGSQRVSSSGMNQAGLQGRWSARTGATAVSVFTPPVILNTSYKFCTASALAGHNLTLARASALSKLYSGLSLLVRLTVRVARLQTRCLATERILRVTCALCGALHNIHLRACR